MDYTRAVNALEPFLALAPSASSPRAAADLVIQATSAPQTYVFAELLQKPAIQALSQSQEYHSHLRLLEIFAWGTYADYSATPSLPTLNAAQHEKLLLLSLLPLCTSASTTPYAALQTALSIPTVRELESLITVAIYADLLTAHMDPQNQSVRVTAVAPLRDLAPGSVIDLLHTLDEWSARCAESLVEIEAEMASVQMIAQRRATRQAKDEVVFNGALAKFEAEKSSMVNSGPGQNGGNPPSGKKNGKLWGSLLPGKGGKRAAPSDGSLRGELMDVDDEDESKGARSTKRKGR